MHETYTVHTHIQPVCTGHIIHSTAHVVTYNYTTHTACMHVPCVIYVITYNMYYIYKHTV